MPRRLAPLAALIGGIVAVAAATWSHAETGYYRWPAVHGDQLYFASEGDLWRAQVDGSGPVRLTTHVQEESSPFVSPDGEMIAFNAHYDGAREVYVMPVGGGAPTQLTFDGGGAVVRGWTPDGKVLYQSRRVVTAKNVVLRAVDVDDLSTETLPFLGATNVAYAGETQYFTRFGLTLSADNSRLYRGGLMAQLWRLRPGDEEAERLADDFGAPIRSPMWWDNRLYFISDKSGDDNLWSFDADGKDSRQHTEFSGWELSGAQLHDGSVCYQRGADLYRYDIAAEQESKIDIEIASDRDGSRVRWLDEPLEYFESARAGAAGESVAITARGRVVVTFPSRRRRVELDIPVEARARSAVVGPDGEWVYLVLDQDRFGEVWRYPADGLGEPEQLTEDSDSHIWRVVPSPDGSRVLFTDKRKRLWSVDLKTRLRGLLETAVTAEDDPFGGFSWTSGGRYVAYATHDERSIRRVALRDLETGRRELVTGGKYESYAPAFSADGKWLYFVSNRHFSPSPGSPWGDRNLGPAFNKRGKLYALQLDPSARFPFAPKTELDEDEEESEQADEPVDDSDDEESEDGDDEAEEPEAVVDFDGLADRIWPVPVEPGDYGALAASAEFLYVFERDRDGARLKSVAIDARDPKVETFASKVAGFALSADRKTVFYRTGYGKNTKLALVPAAANAPGELKDEHRLRIGSWRLGVSPRDEWRQMLLDAWRLHREFAYDADLRGIDWDAVLDKHVPLVDRVGHRAELSDLLAQMIGELGILHSQIRPGDKPRDEESGAAAALGAEYEAVDGGLRITTVYRGDPDFPEWLSPLCEPGVDVHVGDVITAVDGHPIANRADLARRLQSRAGQQVRLDLLRDDAERTEVVEPIRAAAAANLPYRHWVQQTRELVARESDGEIGYVHLQAMGASDIASFARDFYEHYDKAGLIVDVRGNRGGNIDSWVLSALSRKVWAFWQDPAGGPPYGNMQQAFRGHLVVLIDQGTYSDGETFSAGVKALDLAPLIGTQTAGAGIWLTGRNRLVDRGAARIAEFPQFGLDGRWLIEGRGVSPDIPVENPPVATFHGADAQLDAALETLRERIEAEPLPRLHGQQLPPLGTHARDVE